MNINDTINGSNLIYNYKLRTRVSISCASLTYARTYGLGLEKSFPLSLISSPSYAKTF